MGFPIAGVKLMMWLKTAAGRVAVALAGVAGLILAGMRMQAQRQEKKRMIKKAATLRAQLELDQERGREPLEEKLEDFSDHFTN